ncbi:MAG: hypothetical protein ACRD1V_17870 [Vicinamibacterales bacterium]
MWGLVVGLIGTIWDGISTAAAASVTVLWGIVTTMGATLAALGASLWKVAGDLWGFIRPAWDSVIKPLVDDVGKAVWSTLKSLYTDVLKPAWDKLNSLVTKLHGWLATKFAPILKWLNTARAYIQNIYDKVVKPILAVIDVAKQGLALLGDLGVQWAKQLEADLAQIEADIELPFQYALSKLNEVLGWVNKIVDLDGLFQRLVLLNSLVRDCEGQLRILHNLRLSDLTPGDATASAAAQHGKKLSATQQDVIDAITTGGGADGPLTDEMAQTWLTGLQDALG